MLQITSDGGDILYTNYFDSLQARAGLIFVSWNAYTARVLVPDAHLWMISELHSVAECIISRGKMDGNDALELMFEDSTDSPFAIFMGMHQTDRIIRNDCTPFTVAVWTRVGKVAQWPGYYRVVTELPFLEPWKKLNRGSKPKTVPINNPMKSSPSTNVSIDNANVVEGNAGEITVNPQDVIRRFFSDIPHILSSKPYPKTLDRSLALWHCYTPDGGHSILALIAKSSPMMDSLESPFLLCDMQSVSVGYNLENILSGDHRDIEQWLVPVCVKTVLRGYRIQRGYVVVDLEYNEFLGVDVDEDDYEY